jgi:hypothetical protein
MNYKIAAERGRDKGAAVIVSLLLSPVTSYLYLIAVPVQDKNLEVD